MSTASRISKLERLASNGGECPHGLSVWYGSDDGSNSEPPDSAETCPQCGLPRVLLVVTYGAETG